MYNQIKKIRENLEKRGYTNNIPTDMFGKELMILFGMRKKTSIEWIKTFEGVGLIKIEEDKVIFL